MFVKPTHSGTGLPHHISNADAIETELAKPLGGNFYDPSVRLRFVTLRITHLPSPSLPDSTWIAPIKKGRQSISVLFINWMKTVSLWCRKLIADRRNCQYGHGTNKSRRLVRREFHK